MPKQEKEIKKSNKWYWIEKEEKLMEMDKKISKIIHPKWYNKKNKSKKF